MAKPTRIFKIVNLKGTESYKKIWHGTGPLRIHLRHHPLRHDEWYDEVIIEVDIVEKKRYKSADEL